MYYVDLEKTEIIMQKLEGELLSRIDASTRKKFAKLAGELLGKIHLAGIHHGDYTTTNLMACGGKLYVIDFGLSERSAKAEDFATDVLLFKKSVGKEEFADFLAGYKQSFEGKYAEVIGSLKNIEERGRYVARGQ